MADVKITEATPPADGLWQPEPVIEMWGAEGSEQRHSVWWRVLSAWPGRDWWHIEESTSQPTADGYVTERFTAIAVAAWALIERCDDEGVRTQVVRALASYVGELHLSLIDEEDAQFVYGSDPEAAHEEGRPTWSRRRKAYPHEAAS